jgi:hypothetical protein
MRTFLPAALLMLVVCGACAPAPVPPVAKAPGVPPSSSPSALPPTVAPTATPSPSATLTSGDVTATTARPTVQPTSQAVIEPTSEPLTPTPAVTPGPPPTPTPAPIAVWEGTVTLNTYDWEQALVATEPNDAAYPYPRLDFDAVAGPVPRAYSAVFIQNDYVQLVVLPELGGRILRWTDRTTGRQLLYANPVVKPTHWGYRGWWLATGGIEWAFPTEEHGLNEYRPWQYQLLWNGVRVWDTEDRTGMTVEVTIQLEPGSSRVAITPRITNPTGQAQPYEFWANAMLTLSDANAPSPELTFVLPASEVILHSTSDGSLPGPGGQMSWPVYAGRDFSRYPEWRAPLGVFAPQAADAGFSGAYDLGTDQGIVRTAPAWVRGVKLFCLGDLGSERWTDDGSRYFELWGGLTSTFWDTTTLGPGESVAWTEYWYAVNGMGGITWANAEGAARLAPAPDGVEVAVETAQRREVTILLRQGGVEVVRWEASVGPGLPFRTTSDSGAGGAWGLQVLDHHGTLLIQIGP